MPYRNEYELVKATIREVERVFPQAWILKTHGNGYQRPGIPDILICLHGRMLAVEVKHQKPGESKEHMLERVSTLQRIELHSIQHAGGATLVAWEPQHVIEYLELIDSLVRFDSPRDARPSVKGDVLAPPPEEFLPLSEG